MTYADALEITERARLRYEKAIARKPCPYAVGLAAFQAYQADTKEAGEVIAAHALQKFRERLKNNPALTALRRHVSDSGKEPITAKEA